jgi:FkbH-like protein
LSPVVETPAVAPVSVASSSLIRDLAATLTRQEPALVEHWYQVLFEPARLAEYEIAGVQAEGNESLKKPYLRPLLRLLARYFATGDRRMRSVYRDELLRYSPHRAAPQVRVRYFEEILPGLEDAVTAFLPAQREQAAALLQEVHAPLLAPAKKPLTLLTFGDCLMTETRVFLPEACAEAGVPLDMRAFYFSSRMGTGISTDNVLEAIEKNQAEVAAFSFLSYEGLPMYPALLRDAERLSAAELDERVVQLMAQIRQFVGTVREHTEIPFLIHNVSGLPLTRYRKRLPFLGAISPARKRLVAKLNVAIAELVANTENCLLIDECAVAEQQGLRRSSQSVVPDSIAGDAFFHTQNFGEFLVEEYVEKLRAYSLLRKAKVLLLDFDHTLWRGVMAEGEVEHHHERQKLMKRLQEAGLVLVAVSKNDAGSIRWKEMHLQPEDFALLHINWDLKAQSIEKTAQLLDLGFDSFVFVDDNPVERDLVRQQLPKVKVLDALDPFTWKALEMLLEFPNTRQTAESLARTAMYREQAQRRESMATPMDYGAMMASLGLRVRFGVAKAGDLERVSELVQRTNQFNTTTIRYSRAQLQQFLGSSTHRVYVADLEDRFGQLGLVLVTIVERQGERAIFDSFLMSCRAMGFELERLVIRLVMDAEADAQSFVGRFVPTDRNTPAAELYATNGFRAATANEWLLGGSDPRPERPAWFEILGR